MTGSLSVCRAIALRCARGQISPQIALMEMLIASEDVELVGQTLVQLSAGEHAHELAELARVFADNRAGCARIAELLQAEQVFDGARSPADSIAFHRALFDTLVSQSEETSVALYSLGDPGILAEASAEIVRFLQQQELLSQHTRVLDVGCGIGRMAVALSPHVAHVDGIDISPKMVAAAERRTVGLPNVEIALTSGQDFAPFAAQSKELVLMVDSFPYVFQAGPALVDAIFRESVRVLVRGGHLVLLNFSYRGELEHDRSDVRELAARHDLHGELLGETPFSLWNGAAYSLRRA